MDKKEEQAIVHISVRSIFYALLVIILIWMLFYLRELVYVFLTSIVIASFVEAGVRRLGKHKVNRTLAVIIIYFLALALCGILAYLFIPVFLDQISQFSGFISKYLPDSAAAFHVSSAGVPFSDIFTNLASITSNATAGTIQAAVSVFGGVFNFVLLVVLSFYLSVNDKGIETFLRIISPARDAEYVVGLWRRTERKIGLWFQGQLLLGILIGVLTYLGLLIFDVKYSLLLAAVAAVMELVPFGIILAAVPAIASGFLSHGGTGAFEVFGLYLIVHEFDINLISPLIVQKVVGISSLMVILALLIGLKLAGFWGIMLAIPAAVCLTEFLSDVKRRKGLQI
jgi:predicted PurR-regulated permease PerM